MIWYRVARARGWLMPSGELKDSCHEGWKRSSLSVMGAMICLVTFTGANLVADLARAQQTGEPPSIGVPPTQPPQTPTTPGNPGQPTDEISFFYGGISASLYAYVDAGYLDPGMELGIKLMRAEPQGAIAVACTEAWIDAIPQWTLVRAGDTWMCARADKYTHYLIMLRGLDDRRYTDVYFKMCEPQRGGDWMC